MKNELELELQSGVKESLSMIHVPASLYKFAKEVPELCDAEGDDTAHAARPLKRRKLSIAVRWAAVFVFLAGAISVGVTTYPAFAAYMKGVPGFQIAFDWLTQLRQEDGVQGAVNHGYTPFEAKSVQFGGTTLTISDIYVTDEELLFKTFIRSDEFDVTAPDEQNRYFVGPSNLRGGGSTTGSSIAETSDGSEQPVLQVSYKYHLEENAMREFLDSGQKELLFEVTKHVSNRDLKKSTFEQAATIAVPFDSTKLLHNRVVKPNQRLAITETDPDWKELTLEKLTVQPTTMNLILSGFEDWDVYFPREEGTAPYLKDDKGNIYVYNPSGPGLILDEGKQQLPFMSSVFFDSDVRTLYLHLGEINVTSRKPNGSFDLSLKEDTYPKTVRFMDRDIVIQSVKYVDEGYLHLEIGKEDPGQKLMNGVAFEVEGYRDVQIDDYAMIEKYSELRLKLGIDGFGTAGDPSKNHPYFDLYLPASKQDQYTIEMHRWNDNIIVNKDFPIELQR